MELAEHYSATRLRPASVLAVAVVAAIIALGLYVSKLPTDGRLLGFSVWSGAVLGVVLQRSRFCFFCVTRDYLDHRDASGLIGILIALFVGLIGYYVLFSSFLPLPQSGRLPPGAHIGPISWVLAVGALVFGIGMAISGSCVSAHFYRLGEGALASPFALLGVILGFVLGFVTWNSLYLATVQTAPVIWLPAHLGYGGSLVLQLAVLAGLMAYLLKTHRAKQNTEAPQSSKQAEIFPKLWQGRWPTWVGGLLVAFIGTLAYFRIAPLGVTAEIGSVARTAASGYSWFPIRLEGLDGFSGCLTVVKETLWSRNGLFVVSLVLGAWAAALQSRQFTPRRPTGTEVLRNLVGGVLLGWGSMVALGCTMGTLLSGVMAGALSGWVFGVFCFAGIWLGWRVRQRFSG